MMVIVATMMLTKKSSIHALWEWGLCYGSEYENGVRLIGASSKRLVERNSIASGSGGSLAMRTVGLGDRDKGRHNTRV